MERLLTTLLVVLAAIMPIVASAESEAPETRLIQLTDTPQLGSVVGRRMLGHLIGCALEPQVEATATVAGERFRFPGAVGLAPRWLEQAPSEAEQRWVSACILAQVNYFGVGVPSSLRAPGLDLESLTPSEKEQERFTLHEAGYFGNLFSADPVAYVCQGALSDRERRDLGARKRVCAAISDDPEVARQGLSQCGLKMVGPCGQKDVFEAEGQTYHEVIHVYLEPMKMMENSFDCGSRAHPL